MTFREGTTAIEIKCCLGDGGEEVMDSISVVVVAAAVVAA